MSIKVLGPAYMIGRGEEIPQSTVLSRQGRGLMVPLSSKWMANGCLDDLEIGVGWQGSCAGQVYRRVPVLLCP